MKSILNLIMAIPTFLLSAGCNGQIKNAKTITVKIDGNCEMCEKKIESAANQNKTANLDWNKDSKQATLTFDDTKTNAEEVLKRVALAGYDNEKFLAPDDVYAKLPDCCKYNRINKTPIATNKVVEDSSENKQDVPVEKVQEANQLKTVFENYFTLKDALVKSDGKQASAIAKNLLVNINAVKMDKLSAEEHAVWMKVLSSMKSATDKISATTNLGDQRSMFMDLSAYLYELIKVSKQEVTIYYQNCPMYNDGKGANWLSKENAVKNPYYGSQMLSCGKTIETIK